MTAGLSLDVVTEGRGPKDLLLIHGFGGSRFTWRYWKERLAEHYRLHLIDLKGFGRSTRPRDGRYSPRDLAEEVVRYAAKEDLQDFGILGHSMGGGISLFVSLALEDQGRPPPRALVLIGAAAYSGVIPDLISFARRPILGRLALSLVPARTIVRLGLGAAYHPTHPPPADAIDGYTEGLRAPGGKWAMRQVAIRLAPEELDEIVPRYGSITVPTLLIWGRQDRVIPLWVGERLQQELPNAELVTLEHCGHVPAEEQPDLSYAPVADFLAKHLGNGKG